MNVKALGIYMGRGTEVRLGVLFQYAAEGAAVINRFEADDVYRGMKSPPTLSIAYLAATPQEQQALWADITSTPFNGRHSAANGWLLPSFFQNLLPEGVFRDHVAALRKCDPKDHFEMLAACGNDLPGNVYALPLELARDELAHYVTQDQDALEMSVTAQPLEEGVSLSGVQPKLGVTKEAGRYVGRTKDRETHIIAKLPVVGQPFLPEIEDLSLRLAAAAGVHVCEAYLEPLEKLGAQHGYDLGDADGTTNFLAVVRYDKSPTGRTHCEDFAQVLGEMPEDKYGLAKGADPRTYVDVAAVLLSYPSMGEPAVHELLRRLVVNEMLGNSDMHLKNMGLIYPDGISPAFPPAYDIVAYSALTAPKGHALYLVPPGLAPQADAPIAPGAARPKQALSPSMIRTFCSILGIVEKPAIAVISAAVKAAFKKWPTMIVAAPITDMGKARMLAHFNSHPMIVSLAKRANVAKRA